MLIIADNRHAKVPSFLRKVTGTTGLISTNMEEAQIFKTQKEAEEVLSIIGKDTLFKFKIFELGLVDKDKSPWINVKEMLPKDGQHVLVFSEPLYITLEMKAFPVTCFYKNGFVVNVEIDDSLQNMLNLAGVTHWMPIPDVPIVPKQKI